MRKFEVGEIAVALSTSGRPPVECEVVRLPELMPIGRELGIIEEISEAYLVKVPGDPSPHADGLWAVSEYHLRKLRPGNEASTWDACVWKPAGVVA